MTQQNLESVIDINNTTIYVQEGLEHVLKYGLKKTEELVYSL